MVLGSVLAEIAHQSFLAQAMGAPPATPLGPKMGMPPAMSIGSAALVQRHGSRHPCGLHRGAGIKLSPRRAAGVMLGVIGATAIVAGLAARAPAGSGECSPEPVVIDIPAREPRPGQDRSLLLVLANRDDDDGDGVADADDDHLNGPADERDLAALHIQVADPRAARLAVSSGGAPLRFFERQGDAWHQVGLRKATVAVGITENGAAGATLRIEASTWAGFDEWDGVARIEVEALDAAGGRLGGGNVECRVAPVLLRPATARAHEVFVATGRYDNHAFLTSLRSALEPLGLPLVVHEADDWREMWMQDAFEIATSEIPGSRMHVVLAGLRDCDRFPDTLLAPDTAVAHVAAPRGLAGGDAWADWYGNLEASPPVAAQPQGRVIYGRNTTTGEGFHPDVIRFLAAQQAQAPFWIDTSWLLIKHVDEIVAFMPGPDGRGVLLVPDPEEGLRLAGLGGLAASGEPHAEGAHLVEANRQIARIIAAMLVGGVTPPRCGERARAGKGHDDRANGVARPAGGLLVQLGWDESRVIRLPVAFRVPAGNPATDDPTDAVPIWSNPVNAVFLNGTVLCGSADMPEAVRQTCRERFLAAGATTVVFIDDSTYHRRSGNVHCATNARRE
jgi:protein-arginine deiminase